ncbi:hypothetical protein LCGC14_1788190 [marine sediment metagenome]|uniref:Uncharacterized protein n=1 Tax=marine sediment metagenome TaxID=412755 RepID=A0A0F9HFX6_9ZZZZ
MSDWHPAILGEMLKAVDTAKQMSNPGSALIPDYNNVLDVIYAQYR